MLFENLLFQINKLPMFGGRYTHKMPVSGFIWKLPVMCNVHLVKLYEPLLLASIPAPCAKSLNVIIFINS